MPSKNVNKKREEMKAQQQKLEEEADMKAMKLESTHEMQWIRNTGYGWTKEQFEEDRAKGLIVHPKPGGGPEGNWPGPDLFDFAKMADDAPAYPELGKTVWSDSDSDSETSKSSGKGSKASSGDKDPRDEEEKKAHNKLTKKTAVMLAKKGLNFVRFLGYGGNGIVALFDSRDDEGNATYYVAKCTIRTGRGETDDLIQEGECMKEYARCLHIAQLIQDPSQLLSGSGDDELVEPVYMKDKIKESNAKGKRKRDHDAAADHEEEEEEEEEDGTNGKGQRKKGKTVVGYEVKTLNRLKTLFLMEYLPRGSLYEVVKKYNDHLTKTGLQSKPEQWKISNRVLWHIFACLIRGCIGLRYPVKNQPDHRDESPVGPSVNETVPDPHAKGGKNSYLVHFDLDPMNIMIADFGSPDEGEHHGLLPVMKIIDFGLAWRYENLDIDEKVDHQAAYLLWGHRNHGKANTYTPEQFTAEWDWVPGCPRQLGTKDRPYRGTAGEYGWWSNIYQVGLIMQHLMTLYEPAPRPRAIRVSHRGIKTRDNLPMNDVKTDVYSYAWPFVYDPFKSAMGLDRQLMANVAVCLAHNPRQRPKMRYLEALVERKVNLPEKYWVDKFGEGESDAAIRKWREAVFSDPAHPAGGLHLGVGKGLKRRAFEDLHQWLSSNLKDDVPGGDIS